MKRKVWILNHYAGLMYFDKGGRHYSIAKYLRKKGYEPTIFCSNAKHNGGGVYFDNIKTATLKKESEINIPFIFVSGRPYVGNGKKRIANMIDFSVNLIRIAKHYAEKLGKPDIIYASSVHPLTLVAGIKIAKMFKVKCICEIRDLWPESIVAYSDKWDKNNPLIKVLYKGEKWIYKKSDHIIMTWAGGYDYIIEKGWEREISANKVTYISNGVDIEEYKKLQLQDFHDEELDDLRYVKFVYAGSIRQVNNIQMIVDACKILKEKESRARVLIYGDGEEKGKLEEEVLNHNINNISFKGKISKKLIPSVLNKADVTLLHNSSTDLDRFGQSQNKFYEYLAAGKPIFMTYTVGHSIVESNHCGIELNTQNAENIAATMEKFCNMDKKEYKSYCEEAEKVSVLFDFKELSNRLIDVIEAM